MTTKNQTHLQPNTSRHPVLRVLLYCITPALAILAFGFVSIALAAESEWPSAQPQPQAGVNELRKTLTFRDLGATYPLQLRGIDSRNGVPFGVRADRIVTDAKLHLRYSYSPALLPRVSHLNVLINEEVVASLDVDTTTAGKPQQQTIPIPAHLITDFNRVNVQLIGHYTLECEDPMHSSLWAVVSNESAIELTESPIHMANDLGLLPLPFFDRRDAQRLDLPFVFVGQPDTQELESAGIVASWFGALADYRGARFPVSLNRLPTRGNAVVFATDTDRLPGLVLPEHNGPTLSVIPNPHDTYGKLLLVMGRNPDELKRAAAALALGSQAMSGPTAAIEQLSQIAPRRPYDAPRWLPKDGPVSFGQLVNNDDLLVTGYTPPTIRVPLRLPPDLFAWRQPGVTVDLKYRYTPRPNHDKSTLNVSVGNEVFVKSITIPTRANTADSNGNTLQKLMGRSEPAPAEDRFHVPLHMLAAQSQLNFQYYYDYIREGACRDVLIENVQGHIDGSSTIDISPFSNFLEMPDLAAFANAGFPFTRMADLSETVVVLPQSPDATDYSVYLGLMGQMGNFTGYPVVGVTISPPDAFDLMVDKDLLVLGTQANQPLVSAWAEHMPFGFDGNTRRYTLSDTVFKFIPWLDDPTRNAEHARINLVVRSSGTDAVLAGLESPITATRSAVLFTSTEASGLPHALELLMDGEPEVLEQVQGSLVVLRGNKATSLVAEKTYNVGSLNPIVRAQYYLAQRPAMLVLAAIVSVLLLAVLAYWLLRARARRRLNP